VRLLDSHIKNGFFTTSQFRLSMSSKGRPMNHLITSHIRAFLKCVIVWRFAQPSPRLLLITFCSHSVAEVVSSLVSFENQGFNCSQLKCLLDVSSHCKLLLSLCCFITVTVFSRVSFGVYVVFRFGLPRYLLE
jgi:hypothetical protein